MAISSYLDPRLISLINVRTRDEAIDQLVGLLDKSSKLQDRTAFYSAILEREKLVSTGIGLGVAIPHAKLKGYSDFFIAVGIQKQEGIEWNALDGEPVRLIFLIGGPDDRQTEYLKILSRLTDAIKHPERRKKLFLAKTPQEVIDLFQGC